MEILEMIAEWRRGCTCAPEDHPEECAECTVGLIRAIENREKVRIHSGCITPKFYLTLDRLRDAASSKPKDKNQLILEERIVNRSDLLAMLHEFFRLDSEIRRLRPNIYVEQKDEDHRVC